MMNRGQLSTLGTELVGSVWYPRSVSDIVKVLGIMDQFLLDSIDAFTLSLPVIRSFDSFPKLVARELIDVQPMTAPVGKIFYMDHDYSGLGLKYVKGINRKYYKYLKI